MADRYPSQVLWDGDEPYLPLTADLRLTPTRPGDAQAMLMNTEPISSQNWYSPKPYTEAMAAEGVEKALRAEAPVIDALRSEPKVRIEGCPVSVIREVSTGRPVGFCKLSKVEDFLVPPAPDTPLRLPYTPAPPPPNGPAISMEDAPKWADENWMIGYGIHPKWARKGVTSKAVEVIIEEWAIPHMGLRGLAAVNRITSWWGRANKKGSAAHNATSHHILRKAGFHQVYGYVRKDYNGNDFDALRFYRNL